MMTVFTLGIWTVKPGREDEFVRTWQQLAERTKSDFPDAKATLLRDRDQPRHFISFGPWESLEQIEQWRGSDTFKQLVAQLRNLLDEFSPHTLDLAAEVL